MTDSQTALSGNLSTAENPNEFWPNTPEANHFQQLWFDIRPVIRLLDKRRDELSAIEFNGLLRVALRLRQELAVLTPKYLPQALHGETLREIDCVLDQSFLKPPAAPPVVAEDCS